MEKDKLEGGDLILSGAEICNFRRGNKIPSEFWVNPYLKFFVNFSSVRSGTPGNGAAY